MLKLFHSSLLSGYKYRNPYTFHKNFNTNLKLISDNLIETLTLVSLGFLIIYFLASTAVIISVSRRNFRLRITYTIITTTLIIPSKSLYIFQQAPKLTTCFIIHLQNRTEQTKAKTTMAQNILVFLCL